MLCYTSIVSLLEFSSLAYGFTDERVIAEASAALHPGNIIGLIGANGCGKTTLLRILLGELAPEEGRVQRSKAMRLAYVSQTAQGNADEELFAFVLTGQPKLLQLQRELAAINIELAENPDDELLLQRFGEVDDRFSALGGHRLEHDVARLLRGLSFTDAQFTQPLGQLSGGQRQKACLARAIISEANCFIFDEPTNHLDLAAQQFFMSCLRDLPRGSAVLLVSHDRWLLDALCTHTWELEDGVLYRYPGGFTRVAPLRDERRKQARLAYTRQREHIAKTEDYIRRNIAGQNTRQAQGRRKHLNRMERLEKPKDDPAVSFVLTPSLRTGEQVLVVEKLGFSYGDGETGIPGVGRASLPAMVENRQQKTAGKMPAPPEETHPTTHVQTDHAGLDLNPPMTVAKAKATNDMVIDDVGFTLYRGERLGIIGRNGCGKTTLLKLLARQLAPLRGMVAWGSNVDLGIFSQDSSDLQAGRDLMTELRVVEPTITDSAGRDYLARFGFSGDDVYADVGTLSGGERSRLTLAKIFRRRPNVLLLDEPTNHLDIFAREAIEQFLHAFGGTVLMVSHDRALLSRICNRLIVFPFGAEDESDVTFFRGNYEDYISWREHRRVDEQATDSIAVSKHSTAKRNAGSPDAPENLTLEEITQLAAKAHTSVAGYISKQQDRCANHAGEIEVRIAALEAKISKLRTEQRAADGTQQYARLAELQDDIDKLNSEIDTALEGLERVLATVDAWQCWAEQV